MMKYVNQKAPFYVLMPESKFRVFWNILMIFFILQTATYTPYRIAFITESRPGDEYLDLSIDSYFVTDVIINIFTAYPDPVTGLLITNIRAIVLNYLKTDFLFDVVASFPFSIHPDSKSTHLFCISKCAICLSSTINESSVAFVRLSISGLDWWNLP